MTANSAYFYLSGLLIKSLILVHMSESYALSTLLIESLILVHMTEIDALNGMIVSCEHPISWKNLWCLLNPWC